MFPYTVKYTESESNIQNINLLYKHTNNVKIHLKKIQKTRKSKTHLFQKNRFQNDQRFMAMFMARFWRA